MKKIYTLLLALVIVLPAMYAQKGLNIGLHGQSNWINIVNQNTWGNDHEYDYKFTSNYSYGLDVGYNFNNKVGIYTGFSQLNLGQSYLDKYSEEPGGTESDWERSLKLKYNVVPLMFKFTGSDYTFNFIGGFGVSFAFMNEAEQIWTKDGKPWTNDDKLGATIVTERFNSMDIIANLELGARIFILENLYLDATFNFGYGLMDINHADWQMITDGNTYKASHNAYGGFRIGIAYVLFGDDEIIMK